MTEAVEEAGIVFLDRANQTSPAATSPTPINPIITEAINTGLAVDEEAGAAEFEGVGLLVVEGWLLLDNEVSVLV